MPKQKIQKYEGGEDQTCDRCPGVAQLASVKSDVDDAEEVEHADDRAPARCP